MAAPTSSAKDNHHRGRDASFSSAGGAHQLRGFHSVDADFTNYGGRASKHQQQPVVGINNVGGVGLTVTPPTSNHDTTQQMDLDVKLKSHTVPQQRNSSVRSVNIPRRILHRGSTASQHDHTVASGSSEYILGGGGYHGVSASQSSHLKSLFSHLIFTFTSLSFFTSSVSTHFPNSPFLHT